MAKYLIFNGPMQTTASAAVVTTGTAIKTMLQLKALTGIDLDICEWGISFDDVTADVPIKVEFIEVDVAATVTATATADITRIDNPAGPAADSGLVSLGVSATGYTSTSEGTTTALRNLDTPLLLPPTAPFVKQFPLGNWPKLQAGKFLRIRVKATVACNMYCYVVFSSGQ